MHRKVLIVTLVVLLTGCSMFNKLVYRPDIDQGNYLSSVDTAKLTKGMTKQQVVYVLGTPMMQDPFGSNTWVYIFRQQPGNQDVRQQTLTLTFDSQDLLQDIRNEFPLPAGHKVEEKEHKPV